MPNDKVLVVRFEHVVASTIVRDVVVIFVAFDQSNFVLLRVSFRDNEDCWVVWTSFGRLHRRSCEFCREEQQCVSRCCRWVTQNALIVLQLLVNSWHVLLQRALARRQIVAQVTSETNPLVNHLMCVFRLDWWENSAPHSKHGNFFCIWIDSRWRWRPLRLPNNLSQYSHLIRSFTISNEATTNCQTFFRKFF